MTSPSLPLLIEPQQLLPLLDSSEYPLLILDVSSRDNYLKHHVPGAIHIEPKALQCGAPPVPGKLPSIEQLEALFSSIGLRPDHHVIAYDDEGGGWAGRLIWTLDVIGHPHYSYLNGGLTAWVNEGLPLDTDIHQGTATAHPISIHRQPIADLEDVLAAIDRDDCAIWDARSAQEYAGTKVVAKRGGHIPGAINLDWLELMDRQRNLRLVDLTDLQQRLDQLGLSADKEIITHCQTHHRSGLSYLAMKILGYPRIRGYHGSWSEWGNRDDTPIE